MFTKFTDEIYAAKKERVNDLVRESQHYQLVRTLQVAQPKSSRRYWMFLVELWRRRPHFTGYSKLERQRAEYQKVLGRIS